MLKIVPFKAHSSILQHFENWATDLVCWVDKRAVKPGGRLLELRFVSIAKKVVLKASFNWNQENFSLLQKRIFKKIFFSLNSLFPIPEFWPVINTVSHWQRERQNQGQQEAEHGQESTAWELQYYKDRLKSLPAYSSSHFTYLCCEFSN